MSWKQGGIKSYLGTYAVCLSVYIMTCRLKRTQNQQRSKKNAKQKSLQNKEDYPIPSCKMTNSHIVSNLHNRALTIPLVTMNNVNFLL